MVVEIKGQQLRIRIRTTKGVKMFRTHDVGKLGRLHRIAALYRSGWKTQSWRLNLSHYDGYSDALADLEYLKLPRHKESKARVLLKKYFK